MKLVHLPMVVITLALAPLAFTADEMRTKLAIAVVDGDDGGETRIELDSDDLGFNLHDMQVGENRSVVDKEGRTILIRREEDGFSFDVDGKTISVPDYHSDHHGPGRHHGPIVIHDGHHEDVDIELLQDPSLEGLPGRDDIMIVSGKPIDEATQQAIRSLLESAGHDSEVRFIDHKRPHGGPHRIKVIRKRAEVSE